MRVLVVQNYDNTGLGQIGVALADAGAAVDHVSAHAGMTLPVSCDGHDGLVVLGGGQNALADDDYPYLPDLVAMMRGFATSGRAVLGVCLGSQLLARAFGAENRIGGASEFGWSEVSLTDEGRADPLLRDLPATFRPFQWHDDTFTLPRGAVRLATGNAVENQAFRVGRAGYGVQFHFEADRKLVRKWNADFASYLAERQPDWPGRHSKEERLHGPDADRAGLAIARAWVALV